MSVLPEILKEFVPHWNLNLTNEQYHADKTAVSSTGLRTILKSPKAFYRYHTQSESGEKSDALRIGTAVHMAILEPTLFSKRFVIAPKFSGEGSVKARNEWKLTLPRDAVVLKEEEFNDLQEMINSVLKHQDACNILKNGVAEMSGYYIDPETGIKCRIRPDFYHEGHRALLDVKTTCNCESSSFSRSIWDFRYDFQFGMYCEGIHLITGRPVDYPLFLVIEKKAPFECALFMADEELMAKGRADYRIALNKLRDCLETNSWPAYQRKIEPISLPIWALKQGE